MLQYLYLKDWRSDIAGKAYDLTGQRFGRLVAIRRIGSRKKRALWLSQCDCGNLYETTASQLVLGGCKSCGCYKRERTSDSHATHGHTCGGKHSATYATWSSMKQRCDNPNQRGYSNYGGRGISYTYGWTKFEGFLKDMGVCPKGMTLERLDVDGNYTQENCVWADRKTQARNKRSNRILEYQNESRCLAEWAQRFQISQSALCARLKRGWSIKRALETPMRRTRQPKTLNISYRNNTKPLKEWAKVLNLPYGTLWHRIRYCKWSIERAFETPVNDYQGAICFRGKTQNLAAWARELGIPYHRLYLRLNHYKWTVERAFSGSPAYA